jgi:hypothetical protein
VAGCPVARAAWEDRTLSRSNRAFVAAA